jgi:hypothetical protein
MSAYSERNFWSTWIRRRFRPPGPQAQQARRVRKDLRGRKVLLELKGPEDRRAPLGRLAAECGVSLSQRRN